MSQNEKEDDGVAKKQRVASSDLQRVESWIKEGKLVHPLKSREAFSAVDFIQALALTTGLKSRPGTEEARKKFLHRNGLHLTSKVSGGAGSAADGRRQRFQLFGRRLARALPEAQHTVFVLLDGMGLNLVKQETTPFLWDNLVGKLHSVFPATTAAAVTALGTGQFPSEHGLCGWTIFSDGVRYNPLPFTTPENGEELTLPEDRVFHFTSMLPSVPADKIGIFYGFGESKYNKSAHLGLETEIVDCGLKDLSDHVQRLPEFWAKNSDKSTFSYLYTVNPDKTEHEFGIGGKETLDIIATLDDQLKELWENAPLGIGTRRMVVLADHGLLDVTPVNEWLESEVASLCECWSVEPRTPSFHLKDGVSVSDFRAAWSRTSALKNSIALLTPDELEATELMGPGPFSARTREVLGDLVGITCDNSALPNVGHVGAHGGCSRDEVEIPFIWMADGYQPQELKGKLQGAMDAVFH